MAGHSKWANIRFRKGAKDAKRGKIFTKLIREITVAAKMGGGDVDTNPRLRTAIDKALDQNMTRDTIDRAVKRGAGGLEGANMDNMRYEGYGPGGVAILVDCLSDNRNRTVAEVRHAFTKYGGHMGTEGSVAYLFSLKGVISFAPGNNEEKIMEVGIEAGADDVVTNDDGSMDIYTKPDDFVKVKDAMVAAKLNPANAEMAMIAANYVTLAADDAETLLLMQEMLEDLDDVQEVYSNADIPEEILQQLGA